MFKHWVIRCVLATVLASLVAGPVSAGTVSLAWEPVSASDLAGYKVYYGTTSNTLGNSIDVGLVTAVTLSGLADCATHYVALKAYDTGGTESSEFSSVISGWPRPVLASASPQQVQRNTQLQMTLSGTNFQPGATVTFADPAITVTGVSVNGCSQLLVGVSVGSTAALGPATIDVSNPDQVYGTATGLFSVVGDGAGPVVSGVTASSVGATSATIGWTTDEAADGQVFFRLQGESTYHGTAIDATPVTAHELTLQGLMPESTYQYYVRSADGSGNATTSPTRTLTTTASNHDYIRIEAESATPEDPMEVASGAGAFRGGWLEVPASVPTGTMTDPAGRADYGFHVSQAGTYQVWLRIFGPSPQADSLFESVDGAAFGMVFPEEWNSWQWVAGRSYAMEAGLHTLSLGGREAQVQVDRLIITDDPTFVPTEQPGDDIGAPAMVTDMAAVSGEGVNSLSWTAPADAGPLVLVVRYRTDRFPTHPADGFPLAETPTNPGAAGSYEHAGLVNGTDYFYAVFVVDGSGNASDPATVEGTPALSPPPTVGGLERTDTH